MSSEKGPAPVVEIAVTIDGERVADVAIPHDRVMDALANCDPGRDESTAVSIDVRVGGDVADLARERYVERVADGPEFDGTMEDLLWEYVDVELSATDE